MQFLQAVIKYPDFQKDTVVSSICKSRWNMRILAHYTCELHFCECIFWYSSGFIGFGTPFIASTSMLSATYDTAALPVHLGLNVAG